jgi:dolichol-phosphate mannosyltransferase
MVYILLPAYNEEEGLEHLLDRIARISKAFSLDCRILIVNDGSTDHTGLVIKSYSDRMPIEVITFERNSGITKVFAAGFEKICKTAADDDICITMDSDNTQNPYVILDMLKVIREDPETEIVIASRFEEGGGMIGAPFIRRCLSIGVSYMLRRVVGLGGVKDYSTFYRAYRVRVLKKGFAKYGDDLIKGHGFSAMARLLIKLSTVAGGIKEAPFILRYDLKEGGTGMNITKTILGYLDIMAEHLMLRKDA